MLIKDQLKSVFDTEEILSHAKEILFSEYLTILRGKDADKYILHFDDVGDKEVDLEIDALNFYLHAIVFQYDLINNDNCVRVVVQVGDYTAGNGLVDSEYGRLVLHYNGEPFEKNMYPCTSDYLFMIGYHIS
ncbi:MAG: hypothetical protein ACKOUU_11490 [Acinetobacter tjernbergiae]